MTTEEMKTRTKSFSLRIIKLVESLPSGRTADVVGRQLVRSATSVGANYRASCRAKSNADFIAKMAIVEEEADESAFWLEVIVESGLVKKELVESLLDEADQLVAIVVSSINTARGHKR
jgi:four helix bundle protein